MKLGAQTFSQIFGFFPNFDRNFVKTVAPSGDGNGHSLAHLKGYQEYSFPRLFVPWNIRSHDGTFVPWNIRSLDRSFPGTFVLKTIRSLEHSFPGPFVP